MGHSGEFEDLIFGRLQLGKIDIYLKKQKKPKLNVKRFSQLERNFLEEAFFLGSGTRCTEEPTAA